MTKIISPCKKICKITATAKVCVGCGRTRAEIAGWSQMTHYQRTQIMKRLELKGNT
jgi:hypothetical protein